MSRSLKKRIVMNDSSGGNKQKGVVLIITLLVLLIMIIATISLIRSTDTSLAVLGNVILRQSANASATTAIETVAQNIAFIDFSGPLPSGYYASIQNNESANGVPAVLLTGGDTGVIVSPRDAVGNTTRTVVERMCNTAGSCLVPLDRSGVTDAPSKADELLVLSLGRRVRVGAYYRVTVRVDGPKNTLSYVQTIIVN